MNQEKQENQERFEKENKRRYDEPIAIPGPFERIGPQVIQEAQAIKKPTPILRTFKNPVREMLRDL